MVKINPQNAFGHPSIVGRNSPFRELPMSVSGVIRTSDYNYYLPERARFLGCSLISIDPVDKADPFVLYDPDVRIIQVWEDDRVPSLGELLDVCNRHFGQEG